MDALLQEFPNFMNKFKFENGSVSFSSNRNRVNGFEPNKPPFNPINPHPPNDSSSSSSSCSSQEEDYPYISTTLKFISDTLMEEDLEGKPCMLQDCLALQAAEKSLYDALGQEYPNPSSQFSSCLSKNFENQDDSFAWICSNDSSSSYPTANNLAEKSNWILDQADSGEQTSLIYSPESTLAAPDFCYETHPFEVVRRGMGVASKSYSNGDSLILASNSNSPEHPDKEERDYSPNISQGRKNHQREDSYHLEEGRTTKHSALSMAESEPLEEFDNVLLCQGTNKDSASSAFHQAKSQNGQRKGSNGRTRAKRQGIKEEVVDLSTLLIQCAQAVAIGDQRTANDLLQQIRQNSSHVGDANQRLGHYFAKALEARLAGTRIPAYSPMVSNRTSAAEILKAYQVYVQACPFKRMSNVFANRTICKLAKKATRIHIIDFGILYGFQWPCLIQRLSQRPVGPPRIRITGIELPQPGFRPAERVVETGRRLEKYCERFNVPFEYNVIAQKWETIKYEDLNIDRDEMIVVNCLYRLRNLPDDTVVANSARDRVLKLIHRIRPEIFIHGVVNGTYNAPYFVTRFREALFHFSSLFDMFEANLAREDEQRMLFERETFGRDIMNVIACEGIERVERPETYKQWQARNLRAGFRHLPLDQEIFETVRSMVKSEYDKDFIVDEDGQWMLQGWKGRIIYALSVWKPVYE